MESKRLILSGQKNYESAYKLAYKLAAEQLAGIDDIGQQCRNCGAQYQIKDSTSSIILRYLNQSYLIVLPDIEISLLDSAGEVPLKDKVLILHYIISAKGTPPANRLITFQELPDGNIYSPTFSQRTAKPLADNFGKDPHLLIESARGLGGRPADYGDTAVTIDAFPRVPITIILWQGDEEFPPQANIVFDASVADYLPTEDITVLCETITWRLVRHLRET